MAINPREILRKIRSVQNIKKITKAMEMVSAAKLKRSQNGLLAIRPYADKLQELVRNLSVRAGGDIDAPLLQPHEKVRRVAYVVFSSDKGLCGSFNSNILRLAVRETGASETPFDLYTIGRKGGDFFRKREIEPAGHWQGLPPSVGFKDVREITAQIIGAYSRHEIDEVHLVYTEFVNVIKYRPRTLQFLPFDASGLMGDAPDAAGEPEATDVIFEPDPKTIVEQVIPRFVEVLFYRTLLEALASEHAARMTAMRNATDNAEEITTELRLTYNKARQARITGDLLDIVGGAEALKG